MQRIKQYASAFIASLIVALPASAVLVPQLAHADTVNENICKGILYTEAAANTEGNCDTLKQEDPDASVAKVIRTVIDVFSIVVGAVSVIMIIFGGLRYITSAGDSTNVTSAKNTILYAIVGLVIVIFAQTIVKFVVGRLTE